MMTSKRKKKKNVQKLDAELVTLLDSNKVHLVPITEKRTRRKIVDWIEVEEFCIDNVWNTVKLVQDFVLASYKKETIHYSEVLRFINKSIKDENLHITKKEIESGEHKGVYWKFERI